MNDKENWLQGMTFSICIFIAVGILSILCIKMESKIQAGFNYENNLKRQVAIMKGRVALRRIARDITLVHYDFEEIEFEKES